MPPTADATAPTPPRNVAERAREALPAGSTLVLAVSAMSFGGRAQLRRVGVFALRDGALTELVDTHVDNQQGEALYTALVDVAPVEIGGWDAHFADAWTWVWGRTRERFALWHRDRGEVAIATGTALTLDGTDHAWVDLDQVEVWASSDRVHRDIRLPRPDGDALVVLAVEDGIAELDPTYDALQLDAETTWMVELGQAMAAALNKPFFDQRGV